MKLYAERPVRFIVQVIADLSAIGAGVLAARTALDGRWQIEAVDELSFWLAIVLFALPVLFLLVTWFPLRLKFALRAGAAHRLRKLGDDGRDLLAMRALVNQPTRRARETASLLAGWRESDPDATARLAGLELKRAGLKLR